MARRVTRLRSSSAGPSCSTALSHDLRPSPPSSSTSNDGEDFIRRPRGRSGSELSEGRLHETTSAAVAETGGGSSTNGSKTPIRPRKRTRHPETWKKKRS